jgi:hypothetical protein
MASMDDVARLALAFPDATEGDRRGLRIWDVGTKTFAWERPFSKADIKRFGEATPPPGDILAVRVADLLEKEAVLSSSSGALFTIPHFDGFPAVLVQLKTITKKALEAAVTDGWLACAPPKVTDAYMSGRGK